MNIKISTIDKLFINNLLPKSEGILVQIMSRDISRKTEITDKERDAIKLRPSPQGGLLWDTKNVEKTASNIDFSEAEIRMLKEQVEKLDKAKGITSAMLDTVLKIRDIKIEEEKPKK